MASDRLALGQFFGRNSRLCGLRIYETMILVVLSFKSRWTASKPRKLISRFLLE
jgi:hypothetical protein